MHRFEWDEKKRILVLDKHGIDLFKATTIFNDRYVMMTATSDIEQRFKAVGPLDGKLIALVFTHRGEKIRLITARRARQDESRAYYNDDDG